MMDLMIGLEEKEIKMYLFNMILEKLLDFYILM